MKVSECMTRNVRTMSPDQSLQQAARCMADMDIGCLPVGEGDRLVGMITDRDIAVRGVGQGKSPDAPIRDVMSEDVKYCFEDEDIDHVARNMGNIQVRRLPVLSRDKRLVGIVALGDLAQRNQSRDAIAAALGSISREGGQHSQASGMGRTH
jgi:CBS domain-containing protein